MRGISFSPIAQRDLESALIYIALILKSPRASKGLRKSIMSRLEQASDLPEIGRIYEEVQLETEPIRRLLVEKYWVVYTYTDTSLTVLRIFHTNQDIDEFSLENF